jgi:replicative DNA helicase
MVAKHRNGPTGTVDLHFEKSITRFDNMSDREGPG